MPTPGGDIVHAGCGAQDQAYGPIVQRAQVHRAELLVRVLDGVPEHLAQAGAVRPQHGFPVTFRQAALDLLQFFADQAARKINVDVVGEIHAHIGQAKQGNGADDLDVRQTRHRAFDWHRQQFLDVLGGNTGRLGINVDLCRRHVREGVHRNLAKRHHPKADEHCEAHQDKDLVPQGGLNDCIEH